MTRFQINHIILIYYWSTGVVIIHLGILSLLTNNCIVIISLLYSNRPTSVPMPFYGGDYRPDDEPPPEAVLEEKRILEHQFRRPSPSRLSSTSSSIRPPTAARQGGGISANRSLRARPSGNSPRRSLQRSSAFGNRRSTTITDRGRTASMPAVPIVRVSPHMSISEYYFYF